jgi:hypothetical protein
MRTWIHHLSWYHTIVRRHWVGWILLYIAGRCWWRGSVSRLSVVVRDLWSAAILWIRVSIAVGADSRIVSIRVRLNSSVELTVAIVWGPGSGGSIGRRTGIGLFGRNIVVWIVAYCAGTWLSRLSMADIQSAEKQTEDKA